MSERIHGQCGSCGRYVYRDPGKRHGDGQQDTDARPVWLLGDERDAPNPIQIVQCGCEQDDAEDFKGDAY